MTRVTRRSFLRTSACAAAGAIFSARSWAQVAGANGDLRVAIVGLNGRGREIARDLRTMSGVRVVALCDVDTAVLDRELAVARAAGTSPETVVDFRELLPRRDIDAIAIATPNHLHAVQSIWAMQAGKDVLHEKPVSHNLWEGRQILAAAKKYGRIVQVNTQNRSSAAIAEAIVWTRAGHLGKITAVRGLVYKRRLSIGKTAGPVAPPATVNYDLFQGPAPLVPLRRVNFHYDWHWQWATGNGDMVAQGNHQLDVGRRFLGDPGHPKGVFTIGGRFGYEDDGETPNTFIVHYDYGDVPFYFEVRGLPAKPDELSRSGAIAGGLGTADRLSASMDTYRGISIGNVIHCEGGYVTVPSRDYSLAQAFDRDGKLVKEFVGGGNHHANFIAAVRSRKESDLNGPLDQGHRSCTLVHLANISHRIGRTLKPGEIREQIKGRDQLAEPFGRLSEHLAANEVDLEKTPARFGAPLTFDATTEKFTGENAAAANALRSRDYRAPWVVPQLA
ncbi:MAG TPA: Gfo/Idh/MocA family oxidoreductase [Opitutaceae bacterium]|nr:Gfo/Idh/MocA family oxidoreductase [Opitutaceae bacterium]